MEFISPIHERSDFPEEVQLIENDWIELRDGTRLAARFWLPHSIQEKPVPTILEYIPYRKNDMTAYRDSLRHPYLAGHGYACVRVDIRGNGDSDGLMLDEYLQQELDDGYEVIEWIAKQDWCDGNVGMFGKSWGGFNALQIAAMRPPALKAIITVCSTDDRYADDVHYMGGALLASEMLPWASTMLCYNACPPDPRFVGDRWRELWRNRLEQTPPYVEAWLSHQRRDAFWQHGSISENYADIECAVYAVGGWADGYTNAIPRMLENLSCPRKGLIGPWAHNYPTNSWPQPSIGFMQESLRWWDYWLKGEETGVMAEPMLCSYIQDSFPPGMYRAENAGCWVADPAWPSPNTRLVSAELGTPHGGKTILQSDPLTGMDGPNWLGFGKGPDYALEQSAENARSLCWTVPELTATMILGQPSVRLTLKVNQPVASIAVRLNDVAPDGAATLVTWGLCNLNHRDGHLAPEPLPTDEWVEVDVPLNVCGHRLLAGHRWQVAVSADYWPHLWPAPKPVTLNVTACSLQLPARDAWEGDARAGQFGRIETATPLPIETLKAGNLSKKIEHDEDEQRLSIIRGDDAGIVCFPDRLEMQEWANDHYIMRYEHLTLPEVFCERYRSYKRGDWTVAVKTTSRMTSTQTAFTVVNRVRAFEGDTIIFDKSYTKTIPRDFN